MTTPAARMTGHPGQLQAAAAAATGIGMLLLIRRYPGINHDSGLYLGQALHRLHPDIFGRDLFFAYGSQDSYTLLPELVARLHAWASLPAIFMAGSLLGLLAFAAAAWFWLGRWLPRGSAYWAWLAVLCLPSAYGTVRVFSYAEPFLTSRPWAEALSLFAFGWLVRNRVLLAGLCVLLAATLHPLQAIAGALFGWLWLVQQDRRWLHLAWLGLPILLLGFTGIRPFDGLYRAIDPAWHQDLSDFTPQLYLTLRTPQDWAALGFEIAMLALAVVYWRAQPRIASGFRAGLLAIAIGLGASLALADWLQLALPTALQLWRVQWVGQVLTNGAVGVLLYRDLSTRQWERASILALAAAMAASGFLWAWIPVLAVYAVWPWLSTHMSPGFRRALGMLAWVAQLGLLAAYIAEEWLPFRIAHFQLEWYAFDRRLLAYPLLALGLPLFGVWLWQTTPSRFVHLLLAGLALLLLAAGLWRWDARSPVARALEANASAPALFGTALPHHAQVFWAPPLYPAVWTTLTRADYFSPWQLAGSVFNRGTPREGRLRLERMRPVIEEDMYCQDRSVPAQERAHCRISEATLRHACAPGTPAPPDFLILPYRQAQAPLGHWQVKDPATGETAVEFWLYACPAIMADLDRHTPQ
ncbi:hypothetical protein [Thermomonas flagellata]|uniref:hypothetical protein n=1 Tax=Thermomonas flagellata TaxID=2888524 RepID=UPI001F03C5CA|nr:hypothetical protein [Thermomonas flagellata]